MSGGFMGFCEGGKWTFAGIASQAHSHSILDVLKNTIHDKDLSQSTHFKALEAMKQYKDMPLPILNTFQALTLSTIEDIQKAL